MDLNILTTEAFARQQTGPFLLVAPACFSEPEAGWNARAAEEIGEPGDNPDTISGCMVQPGGPAWMYGLVSGQILRGELDHHPEYGTAAQRTVEEFETGCPFCTRGYQGIERYTAGVPVPTYCSAGRYAVGWSVRKEARSKPKTTAKHWKGLGCGWGLSLPRDEPDEIRGFAVGAGAPLIQLLDDAMAEHWLTEGRAHSPLHRADFSGVITAGVPLSQEPKPRQARRFCDGVNYENWGLIPGIPGTDSEIKRRMVRAGICTAGDEVQYTSLSDVHVRQFDGTDRHYRVTVAPDRSIEFGS